MNPSTIPTNEILEALDLSRAEPGRGFLEALFSRFNTRVLCENASQMVRNAEVIDSAEKPRWPPVFWRDYLERGCGGTCFARVAAFEALLRELGFSARKILGRAENELDHAALLVSQGGRSWICEVGFPLPELLPAQTRRVETPLGELSCAVTPGSFRIEFLSGVPENRRSVEIFDREISEEEFRDRWKATFHPQSRFLSGISLRRQEPLRVVSFFGGEVRVDDRHSRLTVPLAPPRCGRVSELFEIDRELLERAFRLAGEAPSERAGSHLTLYLETPSSPETAFAAIGSREGYRRFLEGVAVVLSAEETPSGWRFRLAPPAADGALSEAILVEEAAPDPGRRAIRIRRRGSVAESEFRVEESRGRTYLVREARFDSPREDLLLNDSLRGRLAGTLAVDLLAWARLASG